MQLRHSDGAIVAAPRFFRDALLLDSRDAPSIFHVFEPRDPPFLSLSRIYRQPYGATEYHLAVNGTFGSQQGFRYWKIDEEGDAGRTVSSFFIVDESASLQSQEWAHRRMRREILNDVQTSLSTHFKNRLAGIQALAEMLRDAPSAVTETAPRLVQAIEALSSALDDIAMGSAPGGPQGGHHDLPIRLNDLASVLPTLSSGDVTIQCALHDVDKATLLPASSLERVLLPVLQNAMESSPRNGVIQVDITEVKEGFAHVVIEDQGEGMSSRVLARAEDPFFTTRPGHMGLGLSQAREALRAAGGQWKIESQRQDGTRVTILLPVTPADHLFR